MKKIICLFLISTSFLGCKKELKVPDSFDYGKVENGVYDNSFFKFKFPVNPDWYVLNDNEVDELYDIGTDLISGENKSLKKALDASKINLAKLITIFKEKPGTNVNFNPSLLVNAESLRNAPLIKSVEDYVKLTKNMMEQTTMQIEYVEEKQKVRVGTKDFGFLKLINTSNGFDITQDYYIIFKNDFVLLFIMSYTNEEDKALVYEMFDKLKI